MKKNKEDITLIQLILAGQIQYYRELVSRYQHKVFSVSLKITNNHKDAEDLSQEVFIKAFQSLSQFNSQSSFSTWLYRIAINKGIDWKRKNKKLERVDNVIELPSQIEQLDSTVIPEESFFSKNQKESMVLMIQKLPKVYQNVVHLYYYENLTYQQIAKKLGVANKTVESRLYRARLMLKDILVKEDVK